MTPTSEYYRWEDGTLLLWVRVQPRASQDAIVGPLEGRLKVRLTAPALEDRANASLIRFIANVFKVAPGQVTLVSGHRGREKCLRIASPRALPPYIAPCPKRGGDGYPC
jgi:uncharacterized protein (TIGR00251 family)